MSHFWFIVRWLHLLAMAFFGTAPVGSLLAGVLASRIGAQNTILAGGVVCVVAAVVFLRALPGVQNAIRPEQERTGSHA